MSHGSVLNMQKSNVLNSNNAIIGTYHWTRGSKVLAPLSINLKWIRLSRHDWPENILLRSQSQSGLWSDGVILDWN